MDRLALSRSTLDRAAHRRSEAGLIDAVLAEPSTRLLLLDGDVGPVTPDARLVLLEGPAAARAMTWAADRSATRIFLGTDDAGRSHVVLALSRPLRADPYGVETVADRGVVLPGLEKVRWAGLREVGQLLDDTGAGLLTVSVALANWHAAHPFCARCGQPTEPVSAGWSRRCPVCGAEHFPRTDPAVIMTVEDDDGRLLLGRHARWPERRFSTLAGFVEPGESLEAAVRREVREESGIPIGRVEYRGSQPWPFPSSLMVAFRAHALDIEIEVDGEELAQARWWTRDQLAADASAGELRLPPRVSVARRLIEDWYGSEITDAVDAWR